MKTQKTTLDKTSGPNSSIATHQSGGELRLRRRQLLRGQLGLAAQRRDLRMRRVNRGARGGQLLLRALV